MKKIILFYKYVSLADPKAEKASQKNLCSSLNITGRVIIAHEGINGTLYGDEESIAYYINVMNDSELFKGIDFKWSNVEEEFNYFPSLKILIRDEIVNLGIKDGRAAIANTGTYLTPEQAHTLLLQSSEDLVLLDTRNNYESAIGTFNNATKPDLRYFRQLPDYIDQNIELFKDKRVLMFCTGGVRCERGSAYLQEKGVAKEVMQIQGGIHRYIEKFPEGFFRGKNYVFDGRIVQKANNDVLGSCLLCNASCDDYTNCLNASCNRHFIACERCLKLYNNACSQECHDLLATHKVKPRPLPQTLIQRKRITKESK